MLGVQEAKKITYAAIDRMREAGVKVEIVPSNSRDNAKTVEKYSAVGRLPASEWNHVTLYAETQEQRDLVFSEGRDLVRRGIVFDTGGFIGGCGRDWELDWSFHVNSH